MASFDSDKSSLLSMPIMTDNSQIDISVDGQDVADAMKKGKYREFRSEILNV